MIVAVARVLPGFLAATSNPIPNSEIHTAFIHAQGDFSTLKFMRDEPMTYTITDGTRDGSVVIKLNGPLTLGNMFALQTELRTVEASIAVFDLSGTEYIDSAGMGILINFYVHAEKAGRKMALAGINNRVEALLDMTHTKSLLRVYPTAAEAEAAA